MATLPVTFALGQYIVELKASDDIVVRDRLVSGFACRMTIVGTAPHPELLYDLLRHAANNAADLARLEKVTRELIESTRDLARCYDCMGQTLMRHAHLAESVR